MDKNMIYGRWNQNTYKIIRRIGQGGVGKVYEVEDIISHQIFALKMSTDMQSIHKEHEMLEQFSSNPWIPNVREIDDYYKEQKCFYYIVMEYIEGKNLKQYVHKKRMHVREIIGLSLLVGRVFNEFHKEGYIFSDLKLENLMIDEKNNKIKLIDLGGIVEIGKSIKEFTPSFDRASWDQGIRRADKGYVIFSMCMMMSTLILNKSLTPKDMNIHKVMQNLKIENHLLIKIIRKGLFQKYKGFKSFLTDLEHAYKEEECKALRFIKRPCNYIDKGINMILVGSILLLMVVIYKCFLKSILI